MTILSIVNAAIASLPDPSLKIWELWRCREEPNWDGGPHARNVTRIFDNNTAAEWVKAVMNCNNPTLFCVIHHGQQTDGTSGAQTPMSGSRRYLPLDDILPPRDKDMINDSGEESEDDAEMRWQNPRNIPMTKTGFSMFERKLQRRILRLQRYLEVIRNHALGFFVDYEQSIVPDQDVVWLHKHDHIVNPPATGCWANRKRICSLPAANQSMWRWNTLAGRLFKDLCCGWVFFWHFGGWTDGWYFGVCWRGFGSLLLGEFLIPIINTTFIELSTAAYPRNSFFPHLILRLNLLTFFRSRPSF